MATILTIPKKIYDLLVSGNFGKADTIGWGAVSVDSTATVILASRASRTGLIIQNNSVKDVYIGADNTVTTVNGIKLEPGDIYENQDWIGAIYGIVAAGTADIRAQEFYTT